MKISKLLLSFAGLAALFCATHGWADRIPRTKPSDYGVPTTQIQLTSPAFSTTTTDDVTLGLDSVFCNGCDPNDASTIFGLEYFFDINLAQGASLNSLTFGPGFDTTNLENFTAVVFDSKPSDGDLCGDTSNYLCNVPISKIGLDFSTFNSTFTCDASGACTVDFTNFNFATFGNNKVVLVATTAADSVLKDNNGQPLTPKVTINGNSVAVPEPGSLWFAGISLLICMGLIVARQRRLQPAVLQS